MSEILDQLVSQDLNSELRIMILEKIIKKLIAENQISLNKQEFEEIENQAIRDLQQKHPNITISENENYVHDIKTTKKDKI